MNRETTTDELIKYSSIIMRELQCRTIGLFRLHGSTKLEMVIEKGEWGLRILSIGSLGGISEEYIPADKGVFKEFGNKKTLSDMLSNPIEFQFREFCKSLEK